MALVEAMKNVNVWALMYAEWAYARAGDYENAKRVDREIGKLLETGPDETPTPEEG